MAVIVTLVFLAPSPTFTLVGYAYGGGTAGHPAVVVPLALAVGAIHLRHSFPPTGRQPRGWPATLLALLAVVYVPTPWWGWNWASLQWFVIASALLLLSGRFAALVTAAVIIGTMAAAVAASAAAPGGTTAGGLIWIAVYWLAGLVLGGASLYGSARLVRVVEELSAARAELAEAAVGHERLRLSRDLHDLLGQSLSAVSLKGDLALALLARDPSAARAEIESLTEVARDALRGIRAVTRDEHVVSLRTECDGAATLLAAAGIDTRVRVDPSGLAPDVERLLAWAVREGVTNVLRHSSARVCAITLDRTEASTRLLIENDGARPPSGAGSGLAGLAERARQQAATVTAGRVGERFRLLLEIPDRAVVEEGR